MKASLIFFVITICCSFLRAQVITNLDLDPDSARGGKSSDIFENVRFIPLETTKESSFTRIYKLEVTDAYFIIHDAGTNAVLIFEHSGKFHAKITKRNPDEYFSVFTLNRNKNEIMLRIADHTLLLYDYNGTFIKEETIPENIGRMHYFNSNSIAYLVDRDLDYSAVSKEDFDLIYSNGFNSPVKKLFPYNPKYVNYEYNLPEDLFSGQDDGTCFFAMPYSYNITHLDSNGIAEQFKLNFPSKYSLPDKFGTDSSFTGKRIAYIFRNSREDQGSQYFEFTPFLKDRYNNYLVFSAKNISRLSTEVGDFLYSLDSKKFYSLNKILGDNMSLGLPVLNQFNSGELHYLKDQILYTSIAASMLFNILINDQSPEEFRLELARTFLTINKKDNPIIIASKLKSKL